MNTLCCGVQAARSNQSLEPRESAGSTFNKCKETHCRSSWKGSAHAPQAMTPVVGDRLNGATNRGCGQRGVRPLPLETAGQDTERLTVNFSAEQKDKTYTVEHLDIFNTH